MKNFFQRLAQRTAVWMQGRYGNDDLCNALVALGIIAMLASILPHCGWLSYVALAAMALAIWRTCSKNIGKRRQENQKYLRLSPPQLRACEEEMVQPQDHEVLPLQELRAGAFRAPRKGNDARSVPEMQDGDEDEVVTSANVACARYP